MQIAVNLWYEARGHMHRLRHTGPTSPSCQGQTHAENSLTLIHASTHHQHRSVWASVRRADLAVVDGAERALLHHLHARRPAT